MTDGLALAREALAEWRWDDARDAFTSALHDRESAEALEGLASAATWLDDAATAIGARERAYRLYRNQGDAGGAARVAIGIADNLLTFSGDFMVASGWLARARRLLATSPESPYHSWIDIFDAFIHVAHRRDVRAGKALAQAAVAHSRRLGDTGGEMFAVALLGLIEASAGRLDEGTRLLDEAVAAVISGDISDPEIAVQVCCVMVTASVRLRDHDRLARWSRFAMDFSRDWQNRAWFSYPRLERAAAQVWWGEWDEAERELLEVAGDMRGRPLLGRLATLRLADLRRRQGRLDEAEALLDELDHEPDRIGMGHRSEGTRAAVALDRERYDDAVMLAERHLRAVPSEDLVERIDALAVLSSAAASLGDPARAAAAAAELDQIAERIGTGPIRAAARMATGVAAGAAGDRAAASRALEEAVDLYESSGAPQEAARARIALARSLLAVGRVSAAVNEARRAHDALRRLGARRDTAAVERLVTVLGGQTGRQPSGSALTAREVEVLRLVAEGRSNDEIAEALVLSVRTVERHISNLYAKIGATGRSARATATAYAHRHGIV
ncbi:MAG: LuxR C-terminal-related transcriptional regulator [Thermoleophilaceae bacterium]